MSMSEARPKPLTVVLVVDHAHVAGGQAKVAFDSALGLLRAGHRPIVFTAAGPIDRTLIDSGLDIRCLGQSDLVSSPSKSEAAVRGVWNIAAERELGRLLEQLPKDRTVTHVHGWAKALSPSIARPIRRSGFPAIYTMHEYFLFCPNGGFYNYQKNHVCTLKPMSAACIATHCDSRSYPRKVWRVLRQVACDHVAGLASVFDDYITISGFQSEIVAPFLPSGARVHRVSNPIATVDLGPKTDAATGDFIFVGRISPEKGPLLFAQAAKEAGVTPVFVGDGPMAAELRARHPEARILGWMPQEEARNLMRSARALVFPSLWYEGQPLSVLEAKSMGTPVIVSDACAAREEIVDGVSGFWFESGSATALARALMRASVDSTIADMSMAAYRSFWTAPPTIDVHVARIVEIYEAALAAPARESSPS